VFKTEYFGLEDIVTNIGGITAFVYPAIEFIIVPLSGLIFVILFSKIYLEGYNDFYTEAL